MLIESKVMQTIRDDLLLLSDDYSLLVELGFFLLIQIN